MKLQELEKKIQAIESLYKKAMELQSGEGLIKRLKTDLEYLKSLHVESLRETEYGEKSTDGKKVS
jgi:hypothetical protein